MSKKKLAKWTGNKNSQYYEAAWGAEILGACHKRLREQGYSVQPYPGWDVIDTKPTMAEAKAAIETLWPIARIAKFRLTGKA